MSNKHRTFTQEAAVERATELFRPIDIFYVTITTYDDAGMFIN